MNFVKLQMLQFHAIFGSAIFQKKIPIFPLKFLTKLLLSQIW